MIVYDLACAQQHAFEGWFRSPDDFATQTAGGLLRCPMCGAADVVRRPARIHIAHGSGDAAPAAPAAIPAAGDAVNLDMQSVLAKAVKEYLTTHTENVGRDFAALARQMHQGETPHRSIRGKVTPDEASELREEGIAAWPVPFGIVFSEDAQ